MPPHRETAKSYRQRAADVRARAARSNLDTLGVLTEIADGYDMLANIMKSIEDNAPFAGPVVKVGLPN